MKRPISLDGSRCESGENSNQPRLWDKADVARFAGVTKRTVDNLMARGLPHLKIGARRVRFDPAEVQDWFRREFSVRRLGPASWAGEEAA